jgi:hypothetical protein
MATTTASITLASSDLVSGMAMNYYKTATLTKGGTSTGLENIQSGKIEYTGTPSRKILLDQSAIETQVGTITNKANKVYVKNLSTDATEYFTIEINSIELGRLYAGDWMFIPWGATDTSADVQVTASVATSMMLEFVLLHE